MPVEKKGAAFATTRNGHAIPLSKIKSLPFDLFLAACKAQRSTDRRLIALFGLAEGDNVRLFSVLADDDASSLYIASTRVSRGQSYPSIAAQDPAFHLFERELAEEFGLYPIGHPELAPVRFPGAKGGSRAMSEYPFSTVTGESVHEVGVGPVHAGVIEPGHFRFRCSGEEVERLEIQLGYQHRGVESLFLSGKPLQKAQLAESIAGDASIAHSLAYALAVEGLAGVRAPSEAESARALLLELERVAIHLGDLSALSGDVAYLSGLAAFGDKRTLVINTTMSICGNRLGKGMIRPGGVVRGLDKALVEKCLRAIDDIQASSETYASALFSSASVLSRFDGTSVISEATARSLGMVGPAARASGVSVDSRSDHPTGSYEFYPVHKITMPGGDVFSRAFIRSVEIGQSLDIARDILMGPDLEPGPAIESVAALAPDSLVVSLVEGWRGETAHIAITNKKGEFARYKIVDPSFKNWAGLAFAMRGNGISDFPICNKSFNLSYCGFDL